MIGEGLEVESGVFAERNSILLTICLGPTVLCEIESYREHSSSP